MSVGSPPCQAICDLGYSGMRLDQLPDIGLEQLVRHPEAAARVEHLLGEKEAVRPVKVQTAPVGFARR